MALVLVASMLGNAIFGIILLKFQGSGTEKFFVVIAVSLNLLLLGFFKYLSFLTENLNVVLSQLGFSNITVVLLPTPIGISFFTFQSLSYVIDVYRKQAPVANHMETVSIYISLFPTLLAGPILRYANMAPYIENRVVTIALFAEGVRRFILGLGKKVLIADTLAVPANHVFAIPSDQLTASLSWFGIGCYTLQIYFDFSGYSDMAIGLGRMMGFRFIENFNYPYISGSIREFWRRWNISLSTWLRDYLYIPLGGNKCSPLRTYFNLITVFFLCGLWHGASWTFVVWGLFHGSFLILERAFLENWLNRLGRVISTFYSVTVVTVGWVFFRSETFQGATNFIKAMAGFGTGTGTLYHVGLYATQEVWVALTIGILGATPFVPWITNLTSDSPFKSPHAFHPVFRSAVLAIHIAVLTSVLVLSVMYIAAGTYNPFIYFRF